MQAVRTFVHEIRRTLRCFSDGNEHAAQVLSDLDQIDLSERNQHDWMASEPLHGRDLRQATDEMPQSLERLANALLKALP